MMKVNHKEVRVRSINYAVLIVVANTFTMFMIIYDCCVYFNLLVDNIFILQGGLIGTAVVSRYAVLKYYRKSYSNILHKKWTEK
jgi:hypothetical protein